MTLDEQFELLTKFYKQLLIEDGFLYEGRMNSETREVDFVYEISEVAFFDDALYINDRLTISNVFLTKKEAMQAVYNRLNTENQRPVDLWEIQIYNQKCAIFDLPQIPINITARTTQIDHVKADLQSKEFQLLALTYTINGLKESLKRLEELT